MTSSRRKATIPPPWNALLMVLVVPWTIFSMQANNYASAWLTSMPQLSPFYREPCTAMKAIMHSTPSPTSTAKLSFMTSSPSLAASASYNVHNSRRSRIILSSLSSATSSHHATSTQKNNNDKEEVADDEAVPILRSLYDAPPRLPVDDDDDNDKNITDVENNEDDNNAPSWVTQVTSGTLPTEEGSPHVLYYEIHRRFLLDDENQQQQHDKKKSKPGLTALFLHGGPGAGCFPNHVRFFSPELYETVVLLDQRGCGRSVPLGEVRDNTLELLVGDVERLRVHLLEQDGGGSDDARVPTEAAVPTATTTPTAVRPWDVILGGSWGVTLALAYAHTYPRHVRAMVLRGVCLFRNREIDWLFGDPPPSLGGSSNGGGLRTSNLRSLLGGGVARSTTQSFRRGGQSIAQTKEPAVASTMKESTSLAKTTAAEMFPKGWQEFSKVGDIAPLQQRLEEFCKGSSIAGGVQIATAATSNNPRSILQKYYQLLLGSDPQNRLKAVKSWMRWEMGVYSSGFPKEKKKEEEEKKKNQNNSTLLVWNPAMASWANEDARVWNTQSVVSMDAIPMKVEEEVVQSLRRFSSMPLSPLDGAIVPEESTAVVDPIPIQPVVVVTSDKKSIPTPEPSSSGNSTTFDPTTYIPAQSMLTCYYSTNDDYCIGSYKPFLSLAPPSSLPLSSWYSSKLPPQQHPSSTTLPTTRPDESSTSSSFPLPPTIAIQGGNDAICPPDTALDLHHVWKEMELRIVLEGGHSMYGDVVAGEIVKALDRFGHALGAEEE